VSAKGRRVPKIVARVRISNANGAVEEPFIELYAPEIVLKSTLECATLKVLPAGQNIVR
jgi:hypothetical protein